VAVLPLKGGERGRGMLRRPGVSSPHRRRPPGVPSWRRDGRVSNITASWRGHRGGLSPRAPLLRHSSRAHPTPQSARLSFARALSRGMIAASRPASPGEGGTDHLQALPGALPPTRAPHALHEYPTTQQPPRRGTPRERNHRARGVSSPPRPAPHTKRGQRARNPLQAKKRT